MPRGKVYFTERGTCCRKLDAGKLDVSRLEWNRRRLHTEGKRHSLTEARKSKEDGSSNAFVDLHAGCQGQGQEGRSQRQTKLALVIKRIVNSRSEHPGSLSNRAVDSAPPLSPLSHGRPAGLRRPPARKDNSFAGATEARIRACILRGYPAPLGRARDISRFCRCSLRWRPNVALALGVPVLSVLVQCEAKRRGKFALGYLLQYFDAIFLQLSGHGCCEEMHIFLAGVRECSSKSN